MVSGSTDNRWVRAERYLATRQFTAARAELESILARDPAAAPAHLMLAGTYLAENHPQLAARHVLTAARHPPSDPMLLGQLVAALIKVGEVVAARGLLDNPMITASPDARVLMRAAGQWQTLGEHQSALALIEQAGKAGAQGPSFLLHRATELMFNGRLDEAEADLERCIAIAHPPSQAFRQLADIRTQTAARNHLSAIEQAIERADPRSKDRAILEFAYYKELEDLDRFDEAWRALERGNAAMHALLKPGPDEKGQMYEHLVDACTPRFLQPEPRRLEGGPCPIFVIGLQRSGTTVVERVLSNHSQVESAGELMDFPHALAHTVDHGVLDEVTVERLRTADWAAIARRYLDETRWRARGNTFYVDKLPGNWVLAGLIHKALPGAPIINVQRDAMDVCFSNWRACFGARLEYRHAYDMESLAAHFRQYQRLMAHWHRTLPGRILDVDYARLVRDPDATARDIFAHCGLPFEPNCTDLARNNAPVATLSAPQVRQPIHTRSSGSWKRYAEQLKGLASALSSSAGQ